MKDIIKRLESGECGDPIAMDICTLFIDRPDYPSLGFAVVRACNGSIDAAVSLVGHLLPGWLWRVATCHVSDDAWVIPDFNDPKHSKRLLKELPQECQRNPLEYFGTDVDLRPPGRPAIALLIAMFRALAALPSQSPTETITEKHMTEGSESKNWDDGAAPGSDIARRKGCTCAILDNHYGKGRGGDGLRWGWYVSGECPVHAPHPSPGGRNGQEGRTVERERAGTTRVGAVARTRANAAILVCDQS